MKKFFLTLGAILLTAGYSLSVYAQDVDIDTTEITDDTSVVTDNSSVFSTNEIIPPQYDGGEQAMFKFLDSVLVVPQSAIEKNISGRVFVRFFVDKDGNIKAPSIQRGLTPECNEAAIEAVKKMPAWIPAQQNGKSVTGFASVPVSFKTQKVVYEYEPTADELTYEQYVLTDKKWVLIEIGGKELPENLPNEPYFIMSVDKRRRRVVEGNGSCADFSTRYNWNMKRWKLTFSKIQPKKKKCRGKKVQVIDGDFFKLLKNTKEYRITNEGNLQIGKEERNRFVPKATFRPEPLKGKKKKK